MKISYRRDVAHSHLIMETDPQEETDEYAVKMICKNDIDGILRPAVEEMDGNVRLVYDISTRHSINGLFERKKMTSADMAVFMESLRRSIHSMEEYLLDPGLLILDPEYIYAQEGADRFFFCISCVPGWAVRNTEALADMLIACIDYDDQELVQTAYQFNMALNSGNFSLDSLYSLMKEQKIEENDRYISRKAFQEEHYADTVNRKEQHSKIPDRQGSCSPSPGIREKKSLLLRLMDHIEDLF